MRTPLYTGLLGRLRPFAAAFALAAVAASAGACSDPNTGVDPPRNKLFFPAGLILDPRTPEGEASRYLFVSNGNNDLSFNAGTIAVVDLEAFFAAWASDPVIDNEGVVQPSFEAFPYCDGERCVLDVGSETSDEFPCRRLGFLPRVVECDERPFIVDGVRVGDFGTVLDVSHEPDGPRLWVPVRGDPSITFIDIEGEYPGPPDLRCGQSGSGEADDQARCGDSHKLTHFRNDERLSEILREPFNIHISEGEGYRYGVVAHSSGAAVTLIDLDGLRGGGGRPAIVDIADLFLPTGGSPTGGFGLTTRPCGPCDTPGPDPIDIENIPSITRECTRPLLYGAFRFQLTAVSLTADGLSLGEMPPGAADRDSCNDANGDFAGPYCAPPEDIGKPCAVVCEPRFQNAERFGVGGVDPFAPTSAAALGDVAFGDTCGDDLYLVQTNPGALLKLDTSLGANGVPVDIPAGPPIELCDQPTRMQIWKSEGLAFVSCFQAAYVYVVDLRASKVIGTVVSGTGPHDLVLDEAREVLYVANSLEESVTVIDVGRNRPTRFTEVARIGLQEPFSR